jgi:hypothetical protein
MTNETIAGLFVAVLREALEADRSIRQTRIATRSLYSARRFKERFLPEFRNPGPLAEPQDCASHIAGSLAGR